MSYATPQEVKKPTPIAIEFAGFIFKDFPHDEHVEIFLEVKKELLRLRQSLEAEKASGLDNAKQDFEQLCKGNAYLSNI